MASPSVGQSRHFDRRLLLVAAAPAAPARATVIGSPNDAFANATVVTVAQLPYTSNLDGSGSSVEAMEPPDACAGDFETVWYRITPATTMYLRADTFGSSHDALITIFRGTALTSLTELDCNDNATLDSDDARITFKASGGLTYYVRVSLAEAGSCSICRRSRRRPMTSLPRPRR